MTTIGTTGAGSASVQYPAFYNNVLGTKFKIVFGYRAAPISISRWSGARSKGAAPTRIPPTWARTPTWIPQKKIIPLVQAGLEKEPELPDVPLILDLPVKAEDKPLLQFMARSVDRRATAGDDAGRSGGAGCGAARSVRGDGQGPGVHRRGREGEARHASAIGRHDRRRSSTESSTRRWTVRDRMKAALQPNAELHPGSTGQALASAPKVTTSARRQGRS